MISQLRPGGTVVVLKLNWLGRLLLDLIDLVAESQLRGISRACRRASTQPLAAPSQTPCLAGRV
ncbi:hypothetical protein CA264_20230 [Pontibacter actiniarum]|uniref:Resolvase/invertase-type recombinase catalytic domain-containing protein n=1 Tax=Pontibacter actiniarum TaxID=323450 RepID=A0A1X9YX96_9BACT|nr:hypothetical protein CA264_20230 [Pontibacter actiniarum]